MSLKVTITVEVDNVSAGRYTIIEHGDAGGDNPALTAMGAENAIYAAGRKVIKRIVAMDGDGRDSDRSPFANDPRPLTGKS